MVSRYCFWEVLTLTCEIASLSNSIPVYLKSSVRGLLTSSNEPTSVPVQLSSGLSLKCAAALGRSQVLMHCVSVKHCVAEDEPRPLNIFWLK